MILEASPKQCELYDAVMFAAKTGEKRTVIYGGAAGGGKSFGAAMILAALCIEYPKSRWVIVDQSWPLLHRNLIPTVVRAIPHNYVYRFGSEKIVFKNGSEILLMNEDTSHDSEGMRFMGLEVNGAWIEQIDRISETTYQVLQSRLGRWRVPDPMPFPVMLCTTNPIDNWVKDLIYDKWESGTLAEDHTYIAALIDDNPFLSGDKNYLAGFDYLDPIRREMLLNGNWNAFKGKHTFAYMFDSIKHVQACKPIKGLPIVVSFDFNVDPFTFLVCQHGREQGGREFINIIDEIHVPVSVNDQPTEAGNIIKQLYPGYNYIVTGDASGKHRTVGSKVSAYSVIRQSIGISEGQVQVFDVNHSLMDSRMICNSVLFTDIIRINPTCKILIKELKKAQFMRGQIVKDRGEHKCDALDAFRYFIHYTRWMKFR